MKLSKKQRFIVALGGLAVVVMFVFPPWVFTYDSESDHIRMDAGYAPIFDPPKPETAWEKHKDIEATHLRGVLVLRTAVRIDSMRLLVQVLATTTGTALLALLFSRRQ